MVFIENKLGSAVYMAAPHISAVHAFTTRLGGVSEGAFSSLNLGVRLGDRPEHVRDNYNTVCRALGITPDDVVCSHQIHETNIRVVTRADRCMLFATTPEEADGLITNDTDIALAVFTADCSPILLHDPVRSVIAAVHAGWRGTVANIAGIAVRKMAGEFSCSPCDIRAAIGPCISVCCYETGSDVASAMRKALGDKSEHCVLARGDKFMVDLKEANRLLLLRAGLRAGNILVSDECTSCMGDKYWSHRRTNGVRGSQAAIIAMKGNAS